MPAARRELTEVARDEQSGPLRQPAEDLVGLPGQLGRVVEDVGDQHGLVDLHPLHALVGEQLQQLAVHAHQLAESGDRSNGPADGLAQRQECDGSDHDRACWNTECPCLSQLFDDFGRVEGEAGVGTEFGDDVVVVGVKPLGHLQWSDVGAVVGAASRGGEVAVQIVGYPRPRGGGKAPTRTAVSSTWS